MSSFRNGVRPGHATTIAQTLINTGSLLYEIGKEYAQIYLTSRATHDSFSHRIAQLTLSVTDALINSSSQFIASNLHYGVRTLSSALRKSTNLRLCFIAHRVTRVRSRSGPRFVLWSEIVNRGALNRNGFRAQPPRTAMASRLSLAPFLNSTSSVATTCTSTPT
eukprot:IDg6722t1